MIDENKAHYVVATGIIVRDGKYLITKRADWEKVFPGMWTVPGGKLEVKDYINKQKDTSSHWYNILEILLKREIKEETGLVIKNIKYLTSMTFIRPDGIPVLVVSLYADYDSGEIILSKDMTEHAWVSLEEAKNYKLIEGIYEELEMLDRHLKGEKIGEWKKENVVEEVRKFVEEECRKPGACYKGAFEDHFIPVVKYSLKLAEQEGADKEIVEIAGWLHDIGSIRGDPNNHHISSSKIAQELLEKLNYPKEKIEQVRHCILNHRASINRNPETKEAKILIEADAMAHFDNIHGIAERVFNGDKGYTLDKLERSYNKLSEKAKLIVKDKLEKARKELA